MTPEQKRMVQETWKQVVPIADIAAGLLYRRLFEIDPSTRALFRATDMSEQRRKPLATGMPASAATGKQPLGLRGAGAVTGRVRTCDRLAGR
jgi:hypothetical protein